MTALKKELRTLAWPTAAIVAIIVVPMAWASTFEPSGVPRDLRQLWMQAFQLSAAGFLIGSAVLAALPFGAEFQHRTMVLLMAQPVSRRRVWLTKHAALLAALIVVGLAGYFAVGPRALADGYPLAQAMFLLVLLCSSGFWTLVAGSTIGGAMFSPAVFAIVELTSSFAVSRITGLELDPLSAHPALTAVRIVYALLTAWLGWRLFAGYQLKAQADAGIAVATGLAERLPALRPRPAGAIANLIRKEVRLQQPTFLIAALFTAVWLAAMLYSAMPPARPQVANVIFTLLLVSYYPLTILVCGTISVGEDTSLGIRGWHLTLPVSSFTQWAVKIGVTLAVGAVLALALPLALTAILPAFVELPGGEIQVPSAFRTAVMVGSLLVISFWSATMFGHTVKAAVAVGILVALLWLAGVLASLLGQRWGLGGDLMTYLMVTNQWSPEDFFPEGASMRRMFEIGAVASGIVLVGLALRHSLTAFRSTQIARRQIVRNGLQLIAVTMLFTFLPTSYFTAAAYRYQSQPVRELEAALQQISAASFAATGSVPESVEVRELEATGLLSDDARRWLAGSRVSQTLMRGFTTHSGEHVQHVSVTVRLPTGSVFRMFYRVPPSLAR